LFQVAGRRLEAGCVLDRRATIEQAPPVFTPAKNIPAFLGGMLADPAHDEAAVQRYSPTLGRAPIRSGPPGGAPSFVYRRTPFVRIPGCLGAHPGHFATGHDDDPVFSSARSLSGSFSSP